MRHRAMMLGLTVLAQWHSAAHAGDTDRGSIANTLWTVETFDERPPPRRDPPVVIVAFGADGAVGGRTSCNSIGGRSPRWVRDGRFEIVPNGPLIMTTMGCGDLPEIEDFADRFWRVMETAKYWWRDGERLRVRLGDGTMAVLIPRPKPLPPMP